MWDFHGGLERNQFGHELKLEEDEVFELGDGLSLMLLYPTNLGLINLIIKAFIIPNYTPHFSLITFHMYFYFSWDF